jgi:N-acetylated-alpha-linked acidic dipeptidase
MLHTSVEALPETQALKLKLKKVRKAIRHLRKASVKLDKKKHKAMIKLRREIWWYSHDRHGCLRKLWWKLRRLGHRIKKWLKCHHGGHKKHCHKGGLADWQLSDGHHKEELATQLLGSSANITSRFDRICKELHSEALDNISEGERDGHDQRNKKALLRAIRDVRIMNNRLRSFEAGMISAEGIKDREWFKHLGVAPGKWLGYGATTFPGLTEAIVFDKDKKAANHEIARLVKSMNQMAKSLKK